MKNLQKMGGISALITAAAFVVGLGMAVTLLAPYQMGGLDPVQKVAFLVDNQAIMYIWILFIYVVFGVFLVVLALALYERLKVSSPAMMQVATTFGLIWVGLVIASGMVFNIGMGTVVDLYGTDPAQAATVWLAIDAVATGLGGGIEIVGGLWILLVGWAALRAGEFPRALNYLGVVIGVAGILTVVPTQDMLNFVFGLGSVVWFIWMGIVLLRSGPSTEE